MPKNNKKLHVNQKSFDNLSVHQNHGRQIVQILSINKFIIIVKFGNQLPIIQPIKLSVAMLKSYTQSQNLQVYFCVSKNTIETRQPLLLSAFYPLVLLPFITNSIFKNSFIFPLFKYISLIIKIFLIQRMNVEEVSFLKYNQNPFDVQYIFSHDEDVHIYRGRPLDEIKKNVKDNCHVLTKGENQCWRIAVEKPSGVGHARSKTSEDFFYHTDVSYNKYQPNHLVLFCQREDSLGGGVSKMIALSTILKRLSPKTIQALKMPVYRFTIVEGFDATLMKGYFQKKLSIIYTGLDGKPCIRFKHDVLLNTDIPEQNIQALKQLKQVLETETPIRFVLNKDQSMVFNNAKFVHARTEIKDYDRALHRLLFNPRRNISYEVKQINEPIDGLKKMVEEFKTKSNVGNLPFDEKMLHCDHIDFSREMIETECLQRYLMIYFKAVTHMYGLQGMDFGEKFRKILNFPEKIEKILIKLNQKKKYLPQFYRPDFLIYETDETNKFRMKICEINSNSVGKGYLTSLILNEIVCKQNNKPIESESFGAVVDAVVNQFQNEEQIYCITNSSPLWDHILLAENVKLKTGRQIIFIKSTDLSVQNEKLYCTSTEKQIFNAILELTAEEIVKLPENILEALAFETNCINDLRSIFICHDKRTMAIIHDQQFYEFIRNKYLQDTELDFLRTYTAKTWSSHQAAAVEQSLKNRQNYVLKACGDGGVSDVIFGAECSFEEWENLLKERKNYVIQEYVACKKLDVLDLNEAEPKVQSYSTVCMFLCYADQMWGTGVLKCGTGKAVRYQDTGFMIPTRIISESERKSQKDSQPVQA